MSYPDVTTWKEAVESSKIPRINWKEILGTSMAKFILERKELGKTKEEVMHEILLKCKANAEKLELWSWRKIAQNVHIGLSARYAEIKIYAPTSISSGITGNEGVSDNKIVPNIKNISSGEIQDSRRYIE